MFNKCSNKYLIQKFKSNIFLHLRINLTVKKKNNNNNNNKPPIELELSSNPDSGNR